MSDAHPIPDVSPRDLFTADPTLAKLAHRILPPPAREVVLPALRRLGPDAAGRLTELAAVADRNVPLLRSHDRRGDRIDQIDYHPAFHELLHAACGEHGLVALAYPPESPSLGGARHAASLLLAYLFGQAEAGVLCPVAMTDAAARLLERNDPALARDLVPRLASRDPRRLATGAMFLTERAGGSDVGRTETTARSLGGDRFALTGHKWFCSNVDAGVVLTLARPTGAPDGTRGLGLFLLPPDDPRPRPGFLINRLKPKLGVRSMASAEVELRDAPAVKVGELDRGFHAMTDMLNTCRLWNAVCSVAGTRRAIAEAWPHVCARRAFGRRLVDHALVRATLADLAAHQHAARRLVFEAVRLLDATDAGLPPPGGAERLRLLTPLLKYRTAKLAVWAASEAMELLGGIGYIEEQITPRLLRDAQVLPIWEGATNIMVLDALRAMRRDASFAPALDELSRLVDRAPASLASEATRCRAAILALGDRAASLMMASDEDALLVAARPLCDRLAATWELAIVLADAADGAAGAGGVDADAACARRLAGRLDERPELGIGAGHLEGHSIGFDELAALCGSSEA